MDYADLVKKRAAQRLQARKKYADELYIAQDGLCYYCQQPTKTKRYIEPQDFIGIVKGWIVWRYKGLVRRDRLATIDHLKPIAEGGTNDRENLVLACQPCNYKRSIPGTP